MILNIILILLFFSCFFTLWYRVSLKIPELIAIPDQVITERLHEDSARLRFFILHLKIFYREGRHKDFLWKFLGKTLYKIHILVLRVDNGLVVLLKKMRVQALFNGNGNSNGSAEYWNKLKKSPDEPSLKNNRVQEVRIKRI